MTTVTLPSGDSDQGTPAATVTVTVSTDGEAPAHGTGPPPEEAVTLREASAATGASVSAMRKAIRSGRLPSTVVEGPNGPEHRVTLSAVRVALPRATANPVVVESPGSREVTVRGDTDLAHVLLEVANRVQEAERRATRAETQRDHFRHELARVRLELREERRALTAAPTDTLSAPSTASRESDPPPGMVMVKRRWWHRRG